MLPKLIKWQDLTPEQKAEVRRAFIYWQHDTTSKTFEEWGARYAFYIRKDGHLANVPKHCEPEWMVR